MQEQTPSDGHFVLEDLDPHIYKEVKMQMENFLSSMVKKIRTESERSVSPMNRKINRDFSQSVKQRGPPLRQTKTEYTRSVVSNLEGINIFSGENSPERR